VESSGRLTRHGHRRTHTDRSELRAPSTQSAGLARAVARQPV